MQQDSIHNTEDDQIVTSRVEKYGRKRKSDKQNSKKQSHKEFLATNIILWSFLLMVITILIFVLTSD